MPKVNENDPRPPYVQIADQIRKAVQAGELNPDDRLPTNREMAAEYGVASMTVHQAIRLLREEGVLVSTQGRGVFVSSSTPEPKDLPELPQQDLLRKELAILQARVDQLHEVTSAKATDKEVSDLRTEVVDLKRQLGVLTSQMIDLYAKLGQPYPRDSSGDRPPKERRRVV